MARTQQGDFKQFVAVEGGVCGDGGEQARKNKSRRHCWEGDCCFSSAAKAGQVKGLLRGEERSSDYGGSSASSRSLEKPHYIRINGGTRVEKSWRLCHAVFGHLQKPAQMSVEASRRQRPHPPNGPALNQASFKASLFNVCTHKKSAFHK